jgi:hypothetical protein
VIQRKKRFENLIESINDIKLKAEGKFFYNKPTLQKKCNLEIEYLVIKAPYKTESTTNVFLEQIPKKTRYDSDIQKENKFDINYNMQKVKGFHPEKIYIGTNNNFLIPHKEKKTHFKSESIQLENTSNVFLMKIPKDRSKNQFVIEDMPDLFIQEWPGKRYVSVGMENMSFPGNLRPEFCLEIDPNEEIFVPNVYDMLLIQNFWDTLEMNHFRICLRPLGYVSNKNLMNVPDINNKENINENQDNNELEKEGNKDEEKKEDKNNNEEGNDILKRQESNQEGGNKKKSKFNALKKSIFGKKGS